MAGTFAWQRRELNEKNRLRLRLTLLHIAYMLLQSKVEDVGGLNERWIFLISINGNKYIETISGLALAVAVTVVKLADTEHFSTKNSNPAKYIKVR